MVDWTRKRLVARIINEGPGAGWGNMDAFQRGHVLAEFDAALSEAGVAIVPAEPTERMREAGGRIIDPYNMTRMEAADVVYRAMLAAAEES